MGFWKYRIGVQEVGFTHVVEVVLDREDEEEAKRLAVERIADDFDADPGRYTARIARVNEIERDEDFPR